MSIFENLSDEQLIKYLKYVHSKIEFIGMYYNSLETFYIDLQDRRGGKEKQIILSPLGKSRLDRLDIEYLYELLLNNDSESLNEGNLDRPQLKTQTVEFVSEERQWVQYTRKEDVETYTDLDNDYLYEVKSQDEIYPWDWEITDEDIKDSDTDDWWFEV
jgi:hypothetical protein